MKGKRGRGRGEGGGKGSGEKKRKKEEKAGGKEGRKWEGERVGMAGERI